MKKLVFIMPLMAVSLLASCNNGGKTYYVTLESDNILTLEKEVCVLDHEDYISKIILKSQFKEKYDLPYSKPYYQVEIDGNQIDNFYIDKVGDNVDYYVNITIPKEQLGDNIVIKTTPYTHYVSFTAVDAGVEIYYRANGGSTSAEIPKFQYCDNPNGENPQWNNWEIGEENKIKLETVGKTIYIRNTVGVFYTSEWFHFATTNDNLKFSADGNVMSLINFGNLYEYCFTNMFYNCKSLISSPKLPATTLADSCYFSMFDGCTALVNAPELPATTLADSCYFGMFDGCTALVNVPELPAITLAEGCYEQMFDGCTALVNVPELPATTLADSCYRNMFDGCTALVNAPELPATTLADSCYRSMFNRCTALVNAPELPATTLADSCYRSMFDGCSKLKINNTGAGIKFFDCPDTTPEHCVYWMFKYTGGSITDDPEPGVTYYYE